MRGCAAPIACSSSSTPCAVAAPRCRRVRWRRRSGVSLRTVYRDVADLQLSGVPIEGEAGVGYVLRKGSDIPPLMFTADELESLVVGTRFVRAFAGDAAGRRRPGGADEDRGGAAAGPARALRAHAHLRAGLARRAPGGDFAARIDRLHAAIEAHRVLQLRLPRRERPAQHARDRAAVPGVLGRQVDAGRVVPAARGLPQLPPGPHRCQ